MDNLVACPECGGIYRSRGLAMHRGRKVCRTVARIRARRAETDLAWAVDPNSAGFQMLCHSLNNFAQALRAQEAK